MVDGKLPYNLKKYFIITKKSQKIPISSLRTIRARKEGIRKAKNRLELSYHGLYPKRKPILVRDNSDGTYTVLDGNSTTYIARRNKWKYIIAEIIETKS